MSELHCEIKRKCYIFSTSEEIMMLQLYINLHWDEVVIQDEDAVYVILPILRTHFFGSVKV